jgi:hypothetical protein
LVARLHPSHGPCQRHHTRQGTATESDGRASGGQASPAHGWRGVHPVRGEAAGRPSSAPAARRPPGQPDQRMGGAGLGENPGRSVGL